MIPCGSIFRIYRCNPCRSNPSYSSHEIYLPPHTLEMTGVELAVDKQKFLLLQELHKGDQCSLGAAFSLPSMLIPYYNL